MQVVAKFRCSSVKTVDYGSGQIQAEVEFNAVCGSLKEDDPNTKWSKATPNGKLNMTITNPTAYKAFEAGKEYRLTLEVFDENKPA